jgi:hypothetical protein
MIAPEVLDDSMLDDSMLIWQRTPPKSSISGSISNFIVKIVAATPVSGRSRVRFPNDIVCQFFYSSRCAARNASVAIIASCSCP